MPEVSTFQDISAWGVASIAITALVLVYIMHLRARFRAEASLRELQLESQHLQHALEASRKSEQVSAQTVAELSEQLSASTTQLAAEQAKSEARQTHFSEQITLLQDAKSSLTKEFELLANRILTNKQDAFKRDANDQLASVISPFKNQLSDFYQRVERAQKEERTQRDQLVGQIVELQKQSRHIGDDAMKLATALKGGNKLQGNWGELVLERLLEMAGFHKGREYHIQASDRDEDGKLFKPDVVVHLPGDRDVIIDSKVSLVAYEKFIHDQEDNAHLKAHYESVMTHIKLLSEKKYDQLQAFRTLDFVFLFIPIEPAYSVLVHHYPDILKASYERNVLVVSPSSLMLALRAIESLWKRDVQDKNIEKLTVSAGKLYDHFVGFVETLSQVGIQLDRASESYHQSFKKLSEGRGNLVKRAEELRKLGARTAKKLPSHLLENPEVMEE